MATQTVEFQAPSGLSITLYLFTPGSDTVIDSAAATERTNDLGTYRAAFTDVTAGTYRAKGISSSVAVSTGRVVLSASTDTYYVYDPVDLTAISSAINSVSVVTTSTSGTDLTAYRNTEWTLTFTSLTTLTGAKVYFTVRTLPASADSASIIQANSTDGLTIVNGSSYATAAHGSVTIDSDTQCTVVISSNATQYLSKGRYYYDMKKILSGEAHEIVAPSEFRILDVVTNAIS